ncbi:DUF4386 domain-containing protein [Actinokineospora sp. HUAS TT18]|uniref:DUF4386 domain-containing protein n=1 Tax=Actinokineospora sp. HUAS TT18 TaxID=3447451 RepID=UPI003F528669
MTSPRTTATAAGVLYLLTHVTSIAALLLYGPLLDDPGHTGAGIRLGALLEVVLMLTIVGTAITLYPVVRKQNEALAMGYVALRTLEAAVIGVGVVSLLAVITAREAGRALVAVHDWTFLLGPNFVLGTNTVLLAYLFYRSGLVPRFIAVLGLIGGPLVFVSAIGVLFGLYEQVSVPGSLAAVPVFLWELSLAVWLIAKGFKPSPLLDQVR